MTRAALAAVLAGSLAFAASAQGAELVPTITVEAGKHTRVDTPVTVPLEGRLKDVATGSCVVQESRGGQQVAVPHQVEPGAPPHLSFILAGTTPAGTARTIQVWFAAAQAPAPPVAAVVQGDKWIDMTVGGKPVLRYRTATVEPPEGVGPLYARNAYIHPAWTPSGLEVTDDFPGDHRHQRGIWFSWTKTEFEGRHPDWWNLGSGTAAIRFVKIESTAAGPVLAALRTLHEHVDLKAPGGAKTVLRETWDVRVWNTGGPQAGYWLWDLASVQRAAADSPLKLPKYFYGGLGFRGHAEWLKECQMMTSEGKTRQDGNETKGRWFDVSGPLGSKRAGCLILIHPTNFRYPQPLRLHPKHPQTCVAPSQEGDWEIAPGAEYVSRYRFCIHDGAMRPEEAERLWADFAEPPVVKVSE